MSPLRFAAAVNRVADQVEDATEREVTHGNLHRRAGVGHARPTTKPIGRSERDRANASSAEVLCNLAPQGFDGGFFARGSCDLDRECIVDVGQGVFAELDVQCGADDLRHFPDALAAGGTHGELRVCSI